MIDFFISYTGADSDWAVWIAWVLEDAGFSVVLQDWDFLPGDNFVLRMNEAIARSQRTLLVLSPACLAARFTQAEWAAAFKKDPLSKEGRLIPVRVAECSPDGLLAQIVYVDLVGRFETDAQTRLLRAVKARRSRKPRLKPSAPPRFPGAGAGATERPRGKWIRRLVLIAFAAFILVVATLPWLLDVNDRRRSPATIGPERSTDSQAGQPLRWGSLYVRSQTLPVDVDIDNLPRTKLYPGSPEATIELPEGRHRLAATKDSRRWEKSFEIEDSKTKLVTIGPETEFRPMEPLSY